ncbi:type II toxin-antitoxin system HipA family toxin [Falsihalocynthiibacter sp. SS001]|uniref:type II toxin-antitoxin system HipA family toxin n=1 Tax=Falsihalocynthiibacter sp. SS001 TaxID=3349698 RepID=UPI0036D3B5A4
MTTATVELWGTTVGYVSMDAGEKFARFEYEPSFVQMGVELAPIHMPAIARNIYQFRGLDTRAFHGMPGLLADSLPDKFGNSLINVWLASRGRSADDFNAVDRLCYTGQRGMGALEFKPANHITNERDEDLQVAELTELASMAFARSENMDAKLSNNVDDKGLLDILAVGTSAGGARAKAVIAYNPDTKQVRSGQLNLKEGFEHWLIKFDGVQFNGDWGVADPAGYGLLEYSYYEMAKACGIEMMECRLFKENGRNHFMTRRFDRDEKGGKKFVQTFGALAHYDYYNSGQYSYEQLFLLMKKLAMTAELMEEQFRRVVFNLVGCNQDDHVKNFGFMMDRDGQWSLSPAYDLCHSEGSDFTRNHQLRLSNKVNDFTLDDLKNLADYAGIKRGAYKQILEQTVDAFTGWKAKAEELGVPSGIQDHVLRTLRLNW